MKKIYIANIMEFDNDGKITNEWRFHFENEELAKEQVKNALKNGLSGYTQWYTIDNKILNFNNLKHGKNA